MEITEIKEAVKVKSITTKTNITSFNLVKTFGQIINKHDAINNLICNNSHKEMLLTSKFNS